MKNDVQVGDLVFAEYDNGEIVNGEAVKVREMTENRLLVTVKCEQGYRSIYLDKCVSFESFPAEKV